MARETNTQNFAPVINAIQDWIRGCLIDDGSVFSSKALWTREHVKEVKKAFVDHPDGGKGSFRSKLKGQMEKSSPSAQHLMAEMLWAILVFPNNVNYTTKRDQIRDVWSLSGEVLPANHPMLSDDVLSGIGSGGQGYNNFRWLELAFLIELAGDIKERKQADRKALFSGYDNFIQWINSFAQGETRQFKHMLRYFAFPDRVERMSSNGHRRAVLGRFGIAPENETKNWTDQELDDALFKLRTKLHAEHPNEKLDFYEPPLKERWYAEEESQTPPGSAEKPNRKPKISSIAYNTILYGPPGTGKTYDTIERAVQIIDPSLIGDHATHKARFDALRANGQIEFITFHQSYSYEDFVEGLRPVVNPEDESTEARYRYVPGIFKRLAVEALFDCLKPTSPDTQLISFDTLWKKLVEQIELEPDKKYPGLTEKTSYRISLSAKGNLDGTNVLSGKTFLCTRSILEKVFLAKPKSQSVSSSEVMEVVVRGCHSHFVAAMFNELRRIEKSNFAGKEQPLVGVFSPEQKAEIVQAYLRRRDASAYALKPPAECPRYVLVIDEINRGNISKILGELITLIEPDKRLGSEHSLVVTLPYTGDYFVVPNNLYILGTMNTADKSIALVDVALRRRFEFEELRPDFGYCANLPPAMREALETLNHRICLRKDRDHQIGHSYFINVVDDQEFNRVFVRQVIPLLQEYFFNDWEGLRYVLGEQGKQAGAFIKPLAGNAVGEARTKWQWCTDTDGDGINYFQMLVGNYKAT